jgi:hypothetical protein
MASDPKDAPIRTTQDAIKAARRRLDEAEAHCLIRLYRPEDARLTHELHKCLTLGRVALALGLELERGAARGGGRHERLRANRHFAKGRGENALRPITQAAIPLRSAKR